MQLGLHGFPKNSINGLIELLEIACSTRGFLSWHVSVIFPLTAYISHTHITLLMKYIWKTLHFFKTLSQSSNVIYLVTCPYTILEIIPPIVVWCCSNIFTDMYGLSWLNCSSCIHLQKWPNLVKNESNKES